MTRVRVIAGLALRNLRRHLRRTLLTAAAMIIGGGLMVFSLTIGDGTHEAWIDSGVRTDTGHVTVETPEFRRSRKIEDRLPAKTRAVVQTALGGTALSELVETVAPKLTINGLASSAAGARPVRIVGVDPVIEVDFTTIDEQVTEGRYLDRDDRLSAYVGVGLVDKPGASGRLATGRHRAGRRPGNRGPAVARGRHLSPPASLKWISPWSTFL